MKPYLRHADTHTAGNRNDRTTDLRQRYTVHAVWEDD